MKRDFCTLLEEEIARHGVANALGILQSICEDKAITDGVWKHVVECISKASNAAGEIEDARR